MKRPLLITAAIIIVAFFGMGLIPNSSGSPGGRTGSPGDSKITCSSCHGGSAITKVGWIVTDIPETGYIPGQQYTIVLSGENQGSARFGFELTAELSNNAKTGGFATGDNLQVKLLGGGNAVTHTSQGITASGGAKSWTFKWTAPETGSGAISFYASLNGANGDGSTGGDQIFTTDLKNIAQDISTVEEIPLITTLNLYPNPTYDILVLSIDGLIEENTRLVIVSVTGSELYSVVFEKSQVDLELEIPVSGFQQGSYILTLYSESQRIVRKFMVKR